MTLLIGDHGMVLHRLFLSVWLLELVLFPALIVLDIGFSYDLKSNYYARFSYILVFILAIYYHFAVDKRLVLHKLSFVFIVALFVGASKGLIEGNVSPVYAAHVFYCLMPIIMISYGWSFYGEYERSEQLRRDVNRVMIYAFYAGVVAVGLFLVAYVSGWSSYNAIGIWNFVFAGPFLAFQPYGPLYFVISTLGALLAAKRGIIVVFAVYALMLSFLSRTKAKLEFILVAPFVVLIMVFVLAGLEIDATARIDQTIESLAAGDINTASAGRWDEAASALGYLSSRIDHLLLGAGFGAQFLPWPGVPGYENYYSHYTHIGVISYVWVGGVFLSLGVYAFLIYTAVVLLIKVKRRIINKDRYFFVFWLWGILAISMLGAVLMNNSYLWFIIGCCLRLNKASVYSVSCRGQMCNPLR